MSISFHPSWRVRAVAALASAGALATVAAVAPTNSAPSLDPSSEVESAPLSEQVLIAASLDEVEIAPEPAALAPEPVEPEPASPPDPEPVRSVWDRVADCEAGEWTGDGGFVEASANWSATAGRFEGGLQFHPDTWDGYRDPDMPAAAYDATREQQIVVAERVLAEQGWKAWPVCSRKLGLR